MYSVCTVCDKGREKASRQNEVLNCTFICRSPNWKEVGAIKIDPYSLYVSERHTLPSYLFTFIT